MESRRVRHLCRTNPGCVYELDVFEVRTSVVYEPRFGWLVLVNEYGYELDGDYNAAQNIGLKLLTVPEGKRPSESTR